MTETFVLPGVEGRRALGNDVFPSHDAGRSNRQIPDEKVLEYSASQDRALLTLNRKHFVKLHNMKPKHSGIIVCTVDPDFRAMANRIHTAVLNVTALVGALIRVNRSIGMRLP